MRTIHWSNRQTVQNTRPASALWQEGPSVDGEVLSWTRTFFAEIPVCQEDATRQTKTSVKFARDYDTVRADRAQRNPVQNCP